MKLTRPSSIFDKYYKLEDPSAYFGWNYAIPDCNVYDLDLVYTANLQEIDTADCLIHPLKFYAVTSKEIFRFLVLFSFRFRTQKVNFLKQY